MSRWTVCLTPDCPELTQRSRCDDCAREHEKQRGTRQQRGYSAEHDRKRKAMATTIANQGFTCWRCNQGFAPGTPFHLGHCDDDRTIHHGAECVKCNLATSGRVACPHPNHGLPQ